MSILRRIEIRLAEAAPSPEAELLLPVPFGHWDQRCIDIAVAGAATQHRLRAENTPQEALLLRPKPGATLSFRYTIREAPAPVAPHVWLVPDNRLTIASAALAELAQEIAGDRPPADAVRALTDYAAAHFSYAHVEKRFSDGWDAVPAVCGLQRGSCVDINTFVLAAARSLGLRAQYIAGYWFGPDRFETPDMHCWLVFEIDGEPQFWDVAHHLKWGVEGLGPGLNPAGGRRLAMSAARGLAFRAAHGVVQIDHFGEPVWVLPGGVLSEPAISIRLAEECEERAA